MREFVTLADWLRAREHPRAEQFVAFASPEDPLEDDERASFASAVRRFRALLAEALECGELDEALVREAIERAERVLAWPV